MTDKHIGSDFDDFLRDEGILEDAEAVAAKRVIVFQIAREMESADISQSENPRTRHQLTVHPKNALYSSASTMASSAARSEVEGAWS